MLSALNFCLLYGKDYIHRCNIQECNYDFNGFLKNMKERICAEKLIAIQNGNINDFVKKWDFLQD